MKSNEEQSIPKEVVVAVSGAFDPIHIGHIRLMNESKKLGNKLVVILNNDAWLLKKKGTVFMPEEERMEILNSLKSVDEVILTNHESNPSDMSVCEELRMIKPDIFANGGDRKANNIPEYVTCVELDIEMAFNVGGKSGRESSKMTFKNYSEEEEE